MPTHMRVVKPTTAPAPGEALRRDRRVIDPMQWYTPGAGKDAMPMSVRVPYALRHSVDELIASRETPFKTQGELMRSALAWFVNGIWPAFKAQRLDEAMKQLNNYLAEAENDAVVMNVGKLQMAAREKIGALLRIGAKRDAAEAYLRLLRVAEDTHPKLGTLIATWAGAEAAFDPIRGLVEQIEAVMRETPASLCECGHKRERHAFAHDGEGQDVSQCKVRGCDCHEWRFDPPDLDDVEVG